MLRHLSAGIGVMFVVLALFAGDAHAQLCGGERCLSSQFCQLPVGVCDPAEMPVLGLCVDVPVYCEGPYEPVCGCNGETYENECVAIQYRQQIDFLGECPAPEECGGAFGDVCYDPEEYCYLDYVGCCCDLPGHCLDIPSGCPVECSPVCGCNGESYQSLCESQMAPISLEHEGDCDEIIRVRFDAQDELTWRDAAGVSFYNLYRKIVLEWPPADFGDCVQANIPANSTFFIDDPLSAGELWLFLVTGRFADGEGSMGHITTDCSLRAPKAPCGG